MKLFLLLFSTFCFFLISFHAKSQGCSDAGACSVGSLAIVQFKFEILPSEKNKLTIKEVEDTQLRQKLKIRVKEDISLNSTNPPELKTNETTIASVSDTGTISNVEMFKYLKYYFQLSTVYGLGDENTSVYNLQLEGGVNIIKNKLYAQLKLPYTFTSGKLATVHGMSDITLSLSYIAFNRQNSSLSITGGVKLPTNDANIYEDGLPLPMVYQTSLGSTDVLVGAKYAYKKWDFTFGYQHALNANKNQYLNNPNVGDKVTYNDYFESNQMKRADDGIFRLNRNFSVKNATTSAGLLFIYHLADDDITNALGNRVKAIGSKGLTLNLNFSGMVPVSKKLDLVFIFGAPLITRDYRTDGLTRKFVFIAGVKLNLYKNYFNN